MPTKLLAPGPYVALARGMGGRRDGEGAESELKESSAREGRRGWKGMREGETEGSARRERWELKGQLQRNNQQRQR